MCKIVNTIIMSNLTTNPITFNTKKNEVIIDKEKIHWKKQKATLSKKKYSSISKYLNTNYGNIINNNKGGLVFASFDYNDESSIYLMFSPNEKDKTELNYDLYIPSIDKIEIIEEAHDIEKTDEKIIVYGKVYGLCVDNTTYYFKTINIDEYIEFVQRNNTVNDEHIYDEYNLNDEELEDNEDDEDNIDDDLTDDEDISDDELSDTNEDVDDDINGNDDLDDDLNEDDLNGDDIDEEKETKEDEEDEEIIEAVDDEEKNNDDNDGETEELINLDDDDEETIKKPKRKKRANKNSKLIKIINIDDLDVLSDILIEEKKECITTEKDLHIKRQQALHILKKIKLPKKTIHLIEKGIYNYTINKCHFRKKIPIWENNHFTDIYISKVKNIYLNLNSTEYIKNDYLINKMKENEIDPYDLAFIDTFKLFPEKWSDIIDEKMKIEKLLKESLQESASDLFKCPRCHKRKTIHCEVQTRSSDEPMTTFITCLECGKKWKKY